MERRTRKNSVALGTGFHFLVLLILSSSLLAFQLGRARAAAAPAVSEAEWKQTVDAAEKEGSVTVYGPPGTDYQAAITSFQEYFPKIKLSYVPGSGTNNAQRVLTERRADKFLADIFIGGSGTLTLVMHKAGILEPIPPLLIRPESKDGSAWYGKKHTYADAESLHILMMQGNVQTDLGAHNTSLVKPTEIKSFWDILNPKWKGKMAAFDPRDRGHIQRTRALYYNPAVGPDFLKRLFGEMDVTFSRDQRQLLDWVALGKFSVYLFATSNDVEDGKKKGLPVGVLYGLPEEGYMSGGFGHLAVVDKGPHPNATKVFVNWILSKEGQLQWQKKSDNNSLRMDIPKDMLTDQRSIPKEGVKYLNASLPQYEDVTPIMKIIESTLGKAGR